jgi:carboxyl-terminal processing protease
VEAIELPKTEKKEPLHIREKDLENHFEIGNKDEKGAEIEKKPENPISIQMDDQSKGDYQLLRALDLLRGWKILQTMNKAG